MNNLWDAILPGQDSGGRGSGEPKISLSGVAGESGRRQMDVGRVLSSLDKPESSAYYRKVDCFLRHIYPGIGAENVFQSNGSVSRQHLKDLVVGSRLTGNSRLHSRYGDLSITPEPAAIRSGGTTDTSAAETYNFTGLVKKQQCLEGNVARERRKRKKDWRPDYRHGGSSSVLLGIKSDSPPRRFSGGMKLGCTVNRCTASFDVERRFQSMSVMCEQRLLKACVLTQHAPMPDEFRTMAACEALGMMLPVLDQYHSLVKTILREVLRSVYEDPDLVMNQFEAWLHVDNQEKGIAQAPAETILLRSRTYFVRCRELRSEIHRLQVALIKVKEHEGTLLSNLAGARNSLRSIIGKDSLAIMRFMFESWKTVTTNGVMLRKRFQRITQYLSTFRCTRRLRWKVRLRVWFGGLRIRLMKRKAREMKYQLGLRERKPQVLTEAADENEAMPPSSLALPTLKNVSRVETGANTRELIANSLIERAEFFMAEVRRNGDGSSKGNAAITAAAASVTAAAKLAEEKIRLDIGIDEVSPIEDEGHGMNDRRLATGAPNDPGHLADGERLPIIDYPTSSQLTRSNTTAVSIMDEKGKGAKQGDVDRMVSEQEQSGAEIERNKGDSNKFPEDQAGSVRDRVAYPTPKLSRYALQAIVIPEMYVKKLETDAADDFRGARRLEPVKVIEVAIFDSCNGDEFMTNLKLSTLKAVIRKYGSSGDGRIGLFGTLVGWVHENTYIPQAMDLFLAVMAGVFCDKSYQMHTRMIRGEGFAYMPLEAVANVVDELLPVMNDSEHFQSRSSLLQWTDRTPNGMWALSKARKMDLTRSLISMAKPAGKVYLGSTTYASFYCVDPFLQVVDIDVALEKVMRTWFDQRHECRRQLVKIIETFRGSETGERLDYARFCDMIWALSGYAFSAQAVHGLFKIIAVPDKGNLKAFSFRQASVLAEHVLRMVLNSTLDKKRAERLLMEGHIRCLKDKAQREWQEILNKSTRKIHGNRLRMYVAIQARIRRWQTRWRQQMATRIQRLARVYIERRRSRRT